MAPQPDPGQPSRTPRVLVVDDHPTMRGVLRDLLEDDGIRHEPPEVRVVMFTVAEGEHAETVARCAGADAFVPKGATA
jgi:CheY-like chemotaxis protein